MGLGSSNFPSSESLCWPGWLSLSCLSSTMISLIVLRKTSESAEHSKQPEFIAKCVLLHRFCTHQEIPASPAVTTEAIKAHKAGSEKFSSSELILSFTEKLNWYNWYTFLRLEEIIDRFSKQCVVCFSNLVRFHCLENNIVPSFTGTRQYTPSYFTFGCAFI